MRGASVLTALLPRSHGTVARAESPNASLTGRVTDTSNAVIVDATVAAISACTTVRRETTTSDSGEYYLTSLAPHLSHRRRKGWIQEDR